MSLFYHTVRYALVHWGYLAVLAGLLLEHAGLPVPGETTLMFASSLAHKTAELQIQWVILTGIAAAILGDNISFLLGRHWGKTLIRWLKKLLRIDEDDVGAAKDQIRRHGGATIFWARYIFGLRTIAGPLAGTLGMEWKRFVIYNALGALTWVACISIIGYVFAAEFQTLLGFFEKASWSIGATVFLIGYVVWRRKKKHYKERQHEGHA
ncbi:MAG: DedA family protein [Candidatus Acidiferrales bacterium]